MIFRLLLAGGLGLWLVYGFMRADAVILMANAISLTLAMLASAYVVIVAAMWRCLLKGAARERGFEVVVAHDPVS